MLDIIGLIQFRKFMTSVLEYIFNSAAFAEAYHGVLDRKLYATMEKLYKLNTVPKQEYLLIRKILGMYKGTESERLTRSGDLEEFAEILVEFAKILAEFKPSPTNAEEALKSIYDVYSRGIGCAHANNLFIRYMLTYSILTRVINDAVAKRINGKDLQDYSKEIIKNFINKSLKEPYKQMNAFTPTTVNILNTIFGLKLRLNAGETGNTPKCPKGIVIKEVRFEDSNGLTKFPSLDYFSSIIEQGESKVNEVMSYYKRHLRIVDKVHRENPGVLVVTEDFKDNAYINNRIANEIGIKIYDKNGQYSPEVKRLIESGEQGTHYEVIYLTDANYSWYNDTYREVFRMLDANIIKKRLNNLQEMRNLVSRKK